MPFVVHALRQVTRRGQNGPGKCFSPDAGPRGDGNAIDDRGPIDEQQLVRQVGDHARVIGQDMDAIARLQPAVRRDLRDGVLLREPLDDD